MNLRQRPLVALCLLLASSCGGGSDRPLFQELDRNRARWQAQHLVHYAFTARKSGFLPPEHLGPWRIEVDHGAANVTPLGGASPTTDDALRSIDALFDAIEQAAHQEGADVVATYDPVRGFPVSLGIDPIPLEVDDEYGYTLSDFTVLP